MHSKLGAGLKLIPRSVASHVALVWRQGGGAERVWVLRTGDLDLNLGAAVYKQWDLG